MNLTYNNFGLSGQAPHDYDHFLCGRRCKKRRAEKRKLRDEKKRLKNDERRAEIERTRTETNLMKQGFESPPPPPPPAPPQPKGPINTAPFDPSIADRGVAGPMIPRYANPPAPAPAPAVVASQQQETGIKAMPLLIVGGVVVVGGILLVLLRSKKSIQSKMIAAK